MPLPLMNISVLKAKEADSLNDSAINQVETEIKSDETFGVKPIYIHPISILRRSTEGIKYNLGFIILNNSATPFTFETFKAFIDNLFIQIGGVVRMLCTGYYDNGYNKDRRSGAVSVLAKVAENNIQLLLGDRDSTSTYVLASSWNDLFGENIDEFTDGINRIN